MPNQTLSLSMNSNFQSQLDCPWSSPGQVQGFFSGPQPGPQVWSTTHLALNLNLSRPGPEGSGQDLALSKNSFYMMYKILKNS